MNVDLALGSFRFPVAQVVPEITKATWSAVVLLLFVRGARPERWAKQEGHYGDGRQE